jgi:hypothetical protein
MIIMKLLKQVRILVAFCVLMCCTAGNVYAQDDQAM